MTLCHFAAQCTHLPYKPDHIPDVESETQSELLPKLITSLLPKLFKKIINTGPKLKHTNKSGCEIMTIWCYRHFIIIIFSTLGSIDPEGYYY